MIQVKQVFRRELESYFATPVAYVFIVIFLMLSGLFTFYLGNFYERGQADLASFFNFHPWLYLFLMPAVSMGLWSQERQMGTIELLFTLPISIKEAVLGKFLAAWIFAGVALALTFPIWITVNYLGDPDNGVIFSSYLGSWLMAGAYLALGSFVSACTKNQIIAFILTVVLCFLFVVASHPMVLDFFRAWSSDFVAMVIASFSFMQHFEALSRGVIDWRDLMFYLLVIGVGLYATLLVLEEKKAE